MSSSEFLNIYDNAVGFVSAELGPSSDIERVLSIFRGRLDTTEIDPLNNRNLLIEPDVDAQLCNVSRETIDRVAESLHKLQLVHIWGRAICPVARDEGDDSTIVESSDSREFRRYLNEPCPHCGQIHGDLPWSSIETFYAFNVDRTPGDFNIRSILKTRRRRPSPTSSGEHSRTCGKWFFGVVETIAQYFFGDSLNHRRMR